MRELSRYAHNARRVIQTDTAGNAVKVYQSAEEAAEDQGVVASTIRRWAKKGTEQSGYVFQYAPREEKPAFSMPKEAVKGWESFRRPPYPRKGGKTVAENSLSEK